MRGLSTGWPGKGAIVLLIVMAGCADPRIEVLQRASGEMNGMADADLIACAGVPGDVVADGPDRLLQYDTRAVSVLDRGTCGSFLTPASPFCEPPVLNHYNCRTVIRLRDGVVAGVDYQPIPGADSTFRPADCARVVERCLAPR